MTRPQPETRTEHAGLQVAAVLANFVNHVLLPRLELPAPVFWDRLASLITTFTPTNEALLGERDRLQQALDDWHTRHRGQPHDAEAYAQFLREIGYLLPAPTAFAIDTANVDTEIALQAGPQLVVPVKNARFALNAANARWGSLYDALYGTDVIPESDGAQRGEDYNPVRGHQVVAFVRHWLDRTCPLTTGSHGDVHTYRVVDGALQMQGEQGDVALQNPTQFAGYWGDPGAPERLLLVNHGLHVELHFDPEGPVGATDPAHLDDVVLEAAVTTIQDCEDSVAAVDAEDKVAVYRNWLGLIGGDLEASFAKSGRTQTRRLAADRSWRGPDGERFHLPGRSLLLARTVGHLMRTDAILDPQGQPVFEGLLDTYLIAAIAALDVQNRTPLRNSRTGSIYLVKPKMHGPEEVRFADQVFTAVEDALALPRHTLKMGIMDEERRTSVNLAACIAAARHRVVFINTGFLDRTGDEIHTSNQAGPMVPKGDIRHCAWIAAYENNNVDVGLLCGLPGRAQIGKGMWAMPDLMARMVTEKIAHPQAGANTAWVPSPTAAVLHALHYHEVDVRARQRELRARPAIRLTDLLTPPLLDDPGRLSPAQIQAELDNNAQGILGYVVRWIDQGIGCSKVPDIHGVGLMEDRATLRISSQHIGNWLLHGLCTKDQVLETLKRMAVVVDAQNAGDPAYRAMSPAFDESLAFQAACELVFTAVQQPNGYTEPVLHARRRDRKHQDELSAAD